MHFSVSFKEPIFLASLMTFIFLFPLFLGNEPLVLDTETIQFHFINGDRFCRTFSSPGVLPGVPTSKNSLTHTIANGAEELAAHTGTKAWSRSRRGDGGSNELPEQAACSSPPENLQ